MGKTDDYLGFLLEDMDNKFDLIMEILGTLKDVPVDIQQIKADLAEMKQWRGITELVIRDHSLSLRAHEIRIGKFETA
jgi:hypothetical protein